MPRPSKLTDDVIARLAQAVALGATYDLAAAYAGIGAATLRRWRQEAETDAASDLHERLVAALASAEGAAVVGWLAKIEQAANNGHWQAAAWKLERRYPATYGRQVVEHQGDAEHPVTIRVEYVEPDDLSAETAPGTASGAC